MTRRHKDYILYAIAFGLLLLGAIFAIYKQQPHSTDHEQTRAIGSTRCGVERWAVKTLSDPASALVNLTPKRSRVVDLVKLPAPTLPSDNSTRLTSEEQTYLISGTRLTAYKLEGDGDYHLVLTSPLNGDTMIAEIPNPDCVANPVVKTKIAQVRSTFNTQVGVPTTYFTHTKKPVALTGVLFFDFQHGQTGVAPNAVELHPVLSFKLLP